MIKQLKYILFVSLTAIIYFGHPWTGYAQDEKEITFRSPDIAGNGILVPATVNLPFPLSETQTLEVLINGELGCTVNVSDGASITAFGSYYRIKKPGKITARVKENGKIVVSGEKVVKIESYKDYFRYDGPSNADHIERYTGKRVKMLFSNHMKPSDYLKIVTLNTDLGQVIFHNTLLMSPGSFTYDRERNRPVPIEKGPFLHVDLTEEPEWISVEAVLGSE